jgi:hypothetical protein
MYIYKVKFALEQTKNIRSAELRNSYSKPIIILDIKLRRMRWTERVARNGCKNKCILSFSGQTWKKTIWKTLAYMGE